MSQYNKEFTADELNALASLQNQVGFKLLVSILEDRKQICLQELVYVNDKDLIKVQQLYHALGSVLETVQDAEAALAAREQEELNLNNLVQKHSQTGY